jgi:hypothetical protein
VREPLFVLPGGASEIDTDSAVSTETVIDLREGLGARNGFWLGSQTAAAEVEM